MTKKQDAHMRSLIIGLKYVMAHNPELDDEFDKIQRWIRFHVPLNVEVGPDEVLEFIAFYMLSKKVNQTLFPAAKFNDLTQKLEKFTERGRQILLKAQRQSPLTFRE